MFKRKKKETEVVIEKIRSVIISSDTPQNLQRELDNGIKILEDKGYEIISINGYNLEMVRRGSYDSVPRYSLMVVYKLKEIIIKEK